MRTAYRTLIRAECDVLNKIAAKTKMDCWFSIKQLDGQDYVYDLEECMCLELSEGIGYLMEGLDCPENVESCDLNWIEKTVLIELLKTLDVLIPESLEVR